MESPKLHTLKKELQNVPSPALANHLLRIAKYKTENKELLHYLLFYHDNTEEYVAEVKVLIQENFEGLPLSDYAKVKSVRKITRILNKHIKFIADKRYEVELSSYFCELFIDYKLAKSYNKSLLNLLYRQLKRTNKLLPKLHEDLSYDYSIEFERIIKNLKQYKPQFDINTI